MNRITAFIAIILALSLTQTFAQKNEGDDVYGKKGTATENTPGDGKYSITDDTDFSIDNFVIGYIILPSNNIKRGMLRFNGTTVIFMDTLTQKTKRYGADELRGFIAQADTIAKGWEPKKQGLLNNLLGGAPQRKNPFEKGVNGTFLRVDTFKAYADSFIVHAAGGHAAPADRLVHTTKFIKELIYGEKVSLYKLTETIGSSGGMMNGMMMPSNRSLNNVFYVKRKTEKGYTIIPDRKKTFKKFAAEYFKDNTSLVQDIQDEKLNYDNIDDIILRYNNDAK